MSDLIHKVSLILIIFAGIFVFAGLLVFGFFALVALAPGLFLYAVGIKMKAKEFNERFMASNNDGNGVEEDNSEYDESGMKIVHDARSIDEKDSSSTGISGGKFFKNVATKIRNFFDKYAD